MAAKTLPDQAYLCQCLSYDAGTGILTWLARPQHHFERYYEYQRWNSRYAGKSAGTQTRKDNPRIVVMLDAKSHMAHRVIWKMEIGSEVAEVDHKDRNGLNNRWDNLRAAEHHTNCQNRIRRKRSPLPVGVRICGRKFGAFIRAANTPHYLGVFPTIEEASTAYQRAAKRLHGEFVPKRE